MKKIISLGLGFALAPIVLMLFGVKPVLSTLILGLIGCILAFIVNLLQPIDKGV